MSSKDPLNTMMFILSSLILIHSSQVFATQKGPTDGFQQYLRSMRYDHRERPIIGEKPGEPVVVEVSMFVNSIRSVSEATMDYSLEMFFREYWVDPRLDWTGGWLENKSEISLHPSYADMLWKPDTFLPNAIQSLNPKEKSITHRSLIRLLKGGYLLYSRRLSITAECPMDLTLFPFDRQTCRLGIESYGYPNTEIQYHWRSQKEPVQMNKQIRLPDFEITSVHVTQRNYSYETGVYSRLYACFSFKRSAGFCFLQLIIPATAVVIVSWISLWIENETTFQDMIAVILTITFLIFSYNTVMPRVSYIKAMDVYLGACFFFVFLSLVKLAIVKYMRQKLRVTRDTSLTAMNGALPILSPSEEQETALAKESRVSIRPDDFKTILYWRFMHCFHLSSQIVFPLGFLIFCLFYFLAYPRMYAPVDLSDVCTPNVDSI